MLAFVLLFVLFVIYLFFKETDAEGYLGTQTIPQPVALMTEMTETQTIPGQMMGSTYATARKETPVLFYISKTANTSRQSILRLLEVLKGFLAFEAPNIADTSDPTVQLPLENARADFIRLKQEVDMMNRNPGIPPSITETQMEDIAGNLAYLQRRSRLVSVNRPFGDTSWEGFADNSTTNELATSDDIESFLSKLNVEIERLSANIPDDPKKSDYSKFATLDSDTDSVLIQRITNLNKMKTDLGEVLGKIKNNSTASFEVPVYKSDLVSALPILGNVNKPLPQLVQSMDLPPEINNFLPSSMQNDPETKQTVATLLDKYASDFIKGASANATLSEVGTSDSPALLDPRFEGRKSSSVHNSNSKNQLGFGWRERALALEEQIRKRGYQPSDFGCMAPHTKVQPDFSWKGYMKMICSRLQSVYDTGTPEECGCPPPDWNGWSI